MPRVPMSSFLTIFFTYVAYATSGSVAAFLSSYNKRIISNSAFSHEYFRCSDKLNLSLTTVDTETDSSDFESNLASQRSNQKRALLGLLGYQRSTATSWDSDLDPVLACPLTREPLTIHISSPILGTSTNAGVQCTLKSKSGVYSYVGRTDTYFNLLEPVNDTLENSDSTDINKSKAVDRPLLQRLRVLIPPPVLTVLSVTGVLPRGDYIPMRDLFASPSVSFAYERGWRQGFAAAGFPGVEKELEMVREFFKPLNPRTVVDMSCATGLFTRRLALSGDYERVFGCDYSDAMLMEARYRIQSDPNLLSKVSRTRLELIRCDVAKIPMQSDSVDAVHAGAAMHCWPDLDAGLSEINRILKKDGRYFASTFLSQYFKNLGTVGEQSQQAFQYFESADALRKLLMKAGFDDRNIQIEQLGTACVIIKAQK